MRSRQLWRAVRLRGFSTAALLGDVKVLDLSRILAAPFATQMLGDMGATIYKVEHPTRGDDTREWGPPFTSTGHESAYFLSVNRNKHSLAIDLKHAKGVDLVRRLAARCDVVVENFPTGKLEGLGLGYAELSRDNPGLVLASLTGFGSTGPYRDRLAYDVMVSGIGGLMGITGSPDEPAKVGVAISDVCAGLYAHGAILAALLSRTKTGKGKRIEVSLLDTQVATLANVASSYLVSGRVPARMGTQHSSIVPYRAYAARDGHFIVGALNNGQFERMCGALGMAELAADPKFVSNSERVAHRDELDAILQRQFASDTVAHWLALFERARVPCGPINDLKSVFEDPHIVHRQMVQHAQHQTAGSVPLVSPPVLFDDEQCAVRMPPPTLGQHTDAVLRDELGLTLAELRALRDCGAIR